MMPTEGEEAPTFTLPTDGGESVSLEDFRGRKVVLYFYPKDDTPGCTKEACQFQERAPRFDELDTVVLGVSPDSVESHRKFREKYDLEFPLLADVDHEVAEAYGVWKEKSMFGNTFWGVERTTFLIDEEGRIERVWRRVQADGHAEEVAEAVENG
ncbi:MAG: thioredoxin-dependent thiol peroxidase [Longimicrobiales bacterium]|nr:thioredoxin-dependent thiol peroxidase [Longimicrobiales bacterium]